LNGSQDPVALRPLEFVSISDVLVPKFETKTSQLKVHLDNDIPSIPSIPPISIKGLPPDRKLFLIVKLEGLLAPVKSIDPSKLKRTSAPDC